MAKRLPAKRANRANPRADRNLLPHASNVLDFDSADLSPVHAQQRRAQRRHPQGTEPIREVFQPKAFALLPRNLAQETYLNVLRTASNTIVFAMGPAGTGKTLLATQFAIKALIEGRCQRIVITRPAVSVDEQHGFLPGDLNAKLAPWTRPIIDVFKEVYSVATVERMLANEIIEIAPLAYMRGRTFKNAIIIGDEMQNATPSQMKMLLTRIGDGSRMVITGDLLQHDRGFENNGLLDFVSRLKATTCANLAVCEFTASDVERHPVIEDILRVYDQAA
jgi:phosphate starvation-inducible PhoH-like protein